MPEPSKNLVAQLRYFKMGSMECVVCHEPGTVARLAVTLTRQILVTMMCENCGGEEIDGLIERGEMVATPDGTSLVSVSMANYLHEIISPVDLVKEAAQMAAAPREQPEAPLATKLGDLRHYKRRTKAL